MNDLNGRTFLVTGANTGIGYATAEALAARGGRIYVACRSAAKGAAAVAAIKSSTGSDAVALLPLDLADLDSVRACAASYLALGEPLHGLINNAGLGGRQGVTKQGFELAFGVNHLGHFLLTTTLLDCLKADAPSRVVNVSSKWHYTPRDIDFEALRRRGRGISGLRQYGVSKLCNVLFTQELARRLDGTGVTAYALHPGNVASDIWRRVPRPVRPLMTSWMLSTTDGARTSLYCAASEEVASTSGRYYDKCAERAPSRVATPELAAELWKRSVEWAAESGAA